jgi:hypothetical protein
MMLIVVCNKKELCIKNRPVFRYVEFINENHYQIGLSKGREARHIATSDRFVRFSIEHASSPRHRLGVLAVPRRPPYCEPRLEQYSLCEPVIWVLELGLGSRRPSGRGVRTGATGTTD